MSILDKLLANLSSKTLENFDTENLAAEFIKNISLTKLEMYVVTKHFPDSELPDVIGITFNIEAARSLKQKNDGNYISCAIYKLGIQAALEHLLQSGVLQKYEE